jgi:YgiT-type zinc finger domain-containing protein
MPKQLPCSNCGIELVGRDCEETTSHVEVTAEPVFAGEKAVREVPAWICPECGNTQAL